MVPLAITLHLVSARCQIETLTNGACLGIAALVALETWGVCRFKLQFQEIVQVLFAVTCGQRRAAIRLHGHLIVR